MKVLVVGSGGREHALVWKIAQSPEVKEIFCAPGNGGTCGLASNVPVAAEDIEQLLLLARSEDIDLTVVGPEAPLVAGISDRFREAGLTVFGPSQAAAHLEGSKIFAKEFMQRHGIPTARYRVFREATEAESSLSGGEFTFPVVVKADGLAAGKGVLICENLGEARGAVDSLMRKRLFGAAGDCIVVEEFLSGEEASFMVLCDGSRLVPLVPSQDHKKIYDGDRGPNTGGMGAYSTDFILSESLTQDIIKRVFQPTLEGLADQGAPYQGILYAGLMLTREGPKVLEFNVRLGDPETQVVLPRLRSDLLPLLLAAARGDLSNVSVSWDDGAAVCVVMASQGYPGSYEKGEEITGLEMVEESGDAVVFHAGTRREGDSIFTSGGRVLGVTSRASSLEAAIMKAYEGVNKVHFQGMYYRRDIAAKGLARSPRI